MALLGLAGALLLLMIDSAIELALISSMVGYAHRSGANQYPYIDYQGNLVYIFAKPAHMELNQGHTSNGAAGTALVLITFGGFLTLWRERRRERKNIPRGPSRLFFAYTVATVVSFFLTLAALAYTFSVTSHTRHSIDIEVASQTTSAKYPQDTWTPETWTKALLGLPVVASEDVSYLKHWLRVMEGWRWNLIPMLLIGLLVAVLSVQTYRRESEASRSDHASRGEYVMQKPAF